MQPVAQRFGAAQIYRQLVLPEEYLVLPEEYEVHIAGKGEIVDPVIGQALPAGLRRLTH